MECAGRKSLGFVSPCYFPSSIPFPRHPKLCRHGDAEGAVVHRLGETPEEGSGRWEPQYRSPGEQVTFQSSLRIAVTVSWVFSSCMSCKRARLAQEIVVPSTRDWTLGAQERLIGWYLVPNSLSYTHSSAWRTPGDLGSRDVATL